MVMSLRTQPSRRSLEVEQDLVLTATEQGLDERSGPSTLWWSEIRGRFSFSITSWCFIHLDSPDSLPSRGSRSRSRYLAFCL